MESLTICAHNLIFMVLRHRLSNTNKIIIRLGSLAWVLPTIGTEEEYAAEYRLISVDLG